MNSRRSTLWSELKGHLPYSVFATAVGIAMAGLLLYVAMIVAHVGHAAGGHEQAEMTRRHEPAAHDDHEAHEHEHGRGAGHGAALRHVEAGSRLMAPASNVIFHVFHPIHLLFSAIATSAMFWRYERKLLKAVIVGIFGTLLPCSTSDVFIPHLAGLFLGSREMHFHWCLIEHPGLIAPFIIVGVAIGLFASEMVRGSTYLSHTAHVIVSSAASLFYLISFGLYDWVNQIGWVFIWLLVAVTLPCVFSDIIFPLLVTGKEARLHVCCPAHDGAPEAQAFHEHGGQHAEHR